MRYGGTRGQVKFSPKSNGVHLSEDQRVHLGCRVATPMISMAMGMHFLLGKGVEQQESGNGGTIICSGWY